MPNAQNVLKLRCQCGNFVHSRWLITLLA